MRYAALVLAVLSVAGCSRDPNYLKQKYLQSGNKYFDAGRLHEASIMYRKAIDQDHRYGEAYYRLALTNLKEGSAASAYPALRNAYDLLKPGTPESNDAALKLCEISIVAAQSQQRNEQLIKEAQAIVGGLLKRDPDSWEGHKLTGDLAMLDAGAKFKVNESAEAKTRVDEAVQEYRKALLKKPGDYLIQLALGRTLLLEGQTAEAESIFKTLIAKDKNNISGYDELFRVYVAQRQYPEAESVLKSAIQSNPKDPGLRLKLAQFYFAENKRDDLIALLNQMKSDLASFPQAYLQSGDFFIRVGQYDEAIRQFEQGIQKDPKQKNTYLKHEIEAYVRANKPQEAVAKNDEILKSDPKDPDARGLKASFLLQQGNVTQALTELQSVVTARPNNFVAHFNLGRAHFARREYEQARQEFDRAIELQPEYVPARLAQIQVALLRGDNTGALKHADELLNAVPGSVQGKVMKAAALQRLQRFDESRALLESVLEKNPNQVETLLELGVVDLSQKKNKEAIEVFKKAYAADPKNLRGLLGESKALLLDGQAQKSVDLIRTEAENHPERADLARELGTAEMAAGQYDNAIATYQGALGKVTDPMQQGELWGRIAQAYRYKNDTPHAVEALEKSRERLPDNPYIATNLAMLYDELGKKDLARKYYESALRVDQNDPLALNNLAYLITETNGDLDQALTYATRAKQRWPNYPEITDTLGWIYLKKNLTDNALDNFRTLVAQVPKNPTYHYHYAMALDKKGDRNTAKKECEAALADKPNKTQENQIRQLMTKLG